MFFINKSSSGSRNPAIWILSISIFVLAVVYLFVSGSWIIGKDYISGGIYRREIVGAYDRIYDGLLLPRRYHATGVVGLPFDEISEPFEAWFAGDFNMSRIDYYNGKGLLLSTYLK